MTDFKTKMAELAAKYNISHKRDIDWHNFVAEVEQLFHPELKESEDERIIKFLKHVATLDAADELFQEYGVKHTQVIAWLERQKEQKPTEWSEEDEKQIRQIERIVKNARCTQKLQEQIHNWLKSLPERFNLQSKQEWSEEDKEWLSEVYFAIDNSMYSEDERQAMKKYIDSLRSQPKEEWSEEDEKKINFLSRLIEFQVKDDKYCFGDGRLISKQEAIEMLKSLRPSKK